MCECVVFVLLKGGEVLDEAQAEAVDDKHSILTKRPPFGIIRAGEISRPREDEANSEPRNQRCSLDGSPSSSWKNQQHVLSLSPDSFSSKGRKKPNLRF